MINSVKKISIIGGSGTGKTVLSEKLSKLLNIPLHHLDGIHHLENWQVRDKKERDEIILNLIEKESWIIDGTYRSTLKQRLEKSDFIIYLDYSTLAQVKGVMGRYFKNHGKEKDEIPGCKEQMTLSFFILVLKWRKNKRKEIIDCIKDIDKEKIIVFKNRKQLNKWFEKEFNTKIVE